MLVTSEQIGELSAALCKAQSSMKHAVKDANNPHFKSTYADLSSVIEAIRGPLTANGLSWVQGPEQIADGKVSVSTRLMHSSGQWIETTASAQPRDMGPQSVGSVITYLRRYSLSAIAGIASDDDDGEAAEGRGPMSTKSRTVPAKPATPAPAPAAVPKERMTTFMQSFNAGVEQSVAMGQPVEEAKALMKSLWVSATAKAKAPSKLAELTDQQFAAAHAIYTDQITKELNPNVEH